MTLNDIITQMKQTYVSERAARNLPFDDPATWSIWSIKGLWIYVVATVAYLQRQIFNQTKVDTNTIIKETKPHSSRWYANVAKAFQYGFNLLNENGEFDNTGFTADQIAASKIVAHAACIKMENQFGRRFLRLKLAKIVNNNLSPLDVNELNGVKSYFERVGDAGVKLIIESLNADYFKATLKIYYDPTILTNTGSRIDGTASDVVTTAITNYLKNLPFNGMFVLQYFIDAIQAIEGVVNVGYNPSQILAKYGNFPFAPVTDFYNPDAGYLKIYDLQNDLTITYEAHEPVN